jgi:aryl-alcohol dehydrogenase-like predicted oxidoreductase
MMEYRTLGASGLHVPVLSFGTATFGGKGDFFKAWGATQLDEAVKMINLCMDAGINFFDTADVYSGGLAEEILGNVLRGFRHDVLISTKATFVTGKGANDFGSSRHHLLMSLEASLRRLNTDYIDVYHLHGMDGNTPVEETLNTLEGMINSGKVRYIACSNFSGWHLMKSLSVSERHGWSKYIAHQAYYSLLNREFEWELMPLAIDQRVGTIVWSPLASGQLSGKFRRGNTAPPDNRTNRGGHHGPEIDLKRLYSIVDILDQVAAETNKTVAQVALNWVLRRPTVSNVIIGARTEEQLRENLGAIGWSLTIDQLKRLDEVSEQNPIYPYWHQRQDTRLAPLPNFYS